MRLVLTCYRCGSEEFEHTGIIGLTNVERKSYLLPEEIKDNKVICNKCKLEDYIENLIVKFK